MKIISWNINGYRSITGQNPSRRYDVVTQNNKLFDYIYKEDPDIICLQETKASPEQLDEDKRCPKEYKDYYNSSTKKAGYSGVVSFTKIRPEKVFYNIGQEEFDIEGRLVGMDFGEFVLLNIYFPNGTSGDDRVEYKLKFYDAVFRLITDLRSKGRKIVICGDYNTAHKEIDLARPKENEDKSGFLPIERVKIDWLVENNYIDSFREFVSDGGQYTWWSQRGQARANNVGWRIDYFFISDNMKPHLVNCYHQPDIMGSDHCPIILELKF